MLDTIISFRVSGEFAAFRDPSVTSNQTVYYIPSKSATVGMLGAILGVERDHFLGEIYGRAYLDLFKKISMGLDLESQPRKVSFFTNHRSLKESKTKPFKTEVLASPSYRFYVRVSDDTVREALYQALMNNDFQYPPYLGHVYCPARISDVRLQQMEAFDGRTFLTSSVVLDESETYDTQFSIKKATRRQDESRMIIERHLHHFFEKDGQMQRRVLRHWIPVGGSLYEVQISKKPVLSSLMSSPAGNGEQVVCFY
ncbi:MAG: CRISPR-associated protein Cas5 [Thermoproteota archaeon]